MKTVLAAEIMWAAVQDCDRAYDGVFVYAVRTTGVFCRPSCKSRKPHRENVLFFPSSAEAIRAGFRPCKRCQPHVHDAYDAHVLTVRRAEECIRTRPDASVAELCDALALDRTTLSRALNRVCGMSPSRWMERQRIHNAEALLRNTDLPVLDVAMKSGFHSASAFYRAFRRTLRCSPADYRRAHREAAAARHGSWRTEAAP